MAEEFLFTVTAPPPPPPPKPCDNTTPLYGAINWASTDFFLSTDPDYMNQYQLASFGPWEHYGTIGRVPVAPSEYSKLFRKYFHDALTVNFFGIAEEEFQVVLDLGARYINDIGYLFDRQVEGTIPLFRLGFADPFIDVMLQYTIDYSQVEFFAPYGWGYDIVGYICPNR